MLRSKRLAGKESNLIFPYYVGGEQVMQSGKEVEVEDNISESPSLESLQELTVKEFKRLK